MNKQKIKSSTKILAWATLLLNPLAWTADWFFKRNIIQYIVENEIDITQLNQIEKLTVNVPLATIATAFVTVATAYVAGQKGKTISKNTGMPKGKGIDENAPDDATPTP